MHRGDTAPTPRLRLRCQRQTPITFIQPRQQIRQAGCHLLESLIVVAHNPTLVRNAIRSERHAELAEHSPDRISYYITAATEERPDLSNLRLGERNHHEGTEVEVTDLADRGGRKHLPL